MVIILKYSTIATAVKKINSVLARLGPQEICEETYPEVDGENNIFYLFLHPTAFYFTMEEVPNTWTFLLTSTTLSVWFVIFCYKLYSDLTFLNTFITPSMLGLKSTLIWQKSIYLNVLGQKIFMRTNSNTPQWMKSSSQWRYSTWKILLLFPNFQKQYLSMHFGQWPQNINSFLSSHTQGHMNTWQLYLHLSIEFNNLLPAQEKQDFAFDISKEFAIQLSQNFKLTVILIYFKQKLMGS